MSGMNKFLLTGFITFEEDKTHTQYRLLVHTENSNVTENMNKEILKYIEELNNEKPFNMQRTFLGISKHDKLTDYRKEKNGTVSYSKKNGGGIASNIIELTI